MRCLNATVSRKNQIYEFCVNSMVFRAEFVIIFPNEAD